jgi:hypothetical protein
VFQVAAVDWSGNQSAWSTASANTPTDGVYFDEVMTGNLTATGTITGGLIRTAPPPGARGEFDSAGIRLYDGSANDYGAGPGITTRLRSSDGAAFFSGLVSASSIVSNNPAGQPSMDIELGNPPTLTVSDGTRARVQVGTLPSGNYGFGVFDAIGGVIADSDGLVKVMSVLNAAAYTWASGGSIGSAPSMSGGVVPNLSTSFYLSRPLTVFIQCSTSLLYNTGPGYYNPAAWFTVGGYSSQNVYANSVKFMVTSVYSSSPAQTLTNFMVQSLAAGSYTVDQHVGNVNDSWYVLSGQTYVFLLGT